MCKRRSSTRMYSMAVPHYILSVVLYTLSIQAFTIDRPSSLNQETTINTTSPLTLLQLESLNTSLTASPPVRWQYDHGFYHLFIYRKPLHTRTAPTANPGVSLHNWDVAVNRAIEALSNDTKSAGATALDPIPGGRFLYVASLDKSASVHHGNQRKLVFDISKRSTLLYIDVQVILTGLQAYKEEWKTGASGIPQDQVKMCRFNLFQTYDDQDIYVANGTVWLLIPNGDNGQSIYV